MVWKLTSLSQFLVIFTIIFSYFKIGFAQQNISESEDIESPEPTKKPLFPKAREWYNPEVFSRLTLPPKALFGSRWILENKKRINVSFAIEIVDVTLIHSNELTMRVEFNLRQMWDAYGLEFPEGLFKPEDPPGLYVAADFNVLAFMFSPDSYISTARESNMNTVGMPLSLVYIFKNMSIIYKVRMFTKIGCSSSFQWYPMDVQTCNLIIESYKYHSDVCEYHWTPEHLYRPVVVHTKRLLQYEMRKDIHYDSGHMVRGGRGMTYPYVRLKFVFERKLGNNIIQVYTPTTLVVVLSWFSFWLGLDAIPGRISLLVTCMLTLVTMHSGIKATIPPVHYITMMDVWMVFCLSSVFSAMCEFVIVKYLHWRQTQKQKQIDKRQQQENREKLYSIIQQFGGMGGPGGGGCGEDGDGGLGSGKAKMQQGLLPFVSEKQNMNMFWSANASPKIVPVDILRSVVVEAVTKEHQMQNKLDDENDDGETGKKDRSAEEKDGVVEASGESDEVLKKKGIPVWVKIDRFCRACFPFLFCLFNLIYWPVLYCGTEQQE